MFSISPDRARLYTENKQMTVKEPALWNKFLCDYTIPFAWASLLEFIATTHPKRSTFDWWPKTIEDGNDLLNGALSLVVDVIQQKSLAVFPTITGYLPANEAILHGGNDSHILDTAMAEALLPIVYAPPQVRRSINHLFSKRQLTPHIISEHLQGKNDRIRRWTETTKRTVLEYLLHEYPIYGPENLELFPFEDGSYRSLATGITFWHRHNVEKLFFQSAAKCNLDLSKFGDVASGAIQFFCNTKDIKYNVRFRTVEDFATFCKHELFHDVETQDDVIVRETTDFRQLKLAWKWISMSGRRITNKALEDLWLLPFSGHKLRKIRPTEPSRAILMIARDDELYELLDRMDKDKRTKAPYLLRLESMGLKSYDLLFSINKKNEAVYLWDSANLSSLVKWLSLNSEIVTGFSTEYKDAILEHIARKLRLENKAAEIESSRSSIMSLPIFRKLCWVKNEDDQYVLQTSCTSISASAKSIGVPGEDIPILEVEDCQFLVAEYGSAAKDILDTLESSLVKTCTVPKLIEEHVLPSFESSRSDSAIKSKVGEYLLSTYAELSVQARSQLRTLPIIPTETSTGEQGSMFRCISELVDRDAPELSGLFFDHEDVFVTKVFQRRFSDGLRVCKLRTVVDLELINERIRTFSTSAKPIEEIEVVAHKLLESSFFPANDMDYTTIRTNKWLPVKDPCSTSLCLRSAKSCRGIEDQLVAGLAMPILNKSVSSAWKGLLGWNIRVPDIILLEQLDQGLATNDMTVVDAVLSRLYITDRLPAVTPQLMSRAFVWVGDGTFQLPSKAFRSGCRGFEPFLQNVVDVFWNRHTDILKTCGVGGSPSLRDLTDAYAMLVALAPLKLEEHYNAAVNLTNAIIEFPKHLRQHLHVLAADGNFYPPDHLTYPNVKHMANNNHEITYSRITMATAQLLGVELRSDHHIKELLEIADVDDDDEFDQREQITTRISDTLDRYPVESTFREYLANADDAGATEINWLLDERSHTTQGLLTEEMAQVQGPALLVHNNSSKLLLNKEQLNLRRGSF
jgi:sacsin